MCYTEITGVRQAGSTLSRWARPANIPTGELREIVEHLKLGLHIWVSVLIMGTMWRIVSYHLIASPNENLVHLGRAMAQQY